MKLKFPTIKRIIEEEEPVMVALVETKLNEDDTIEIPGYAISRADRTEDGGGALFAIKKTFSNISVCTKEYKKHGAEIVWVKIDNSQTKLKIGVVYMPQECRTRKTILEAIYKDIEEEIQDAAENGFKLLLVRDLNCKVGAVIKGNKEKVTKGGRILLKMTMKQ